MVWCLVFNAVMMDGIILHDKYLYLYFVHLMQKA